jgi:multiple sugar transport system permease protein
MKRNIPAIILRWVFVFLLASFAIFPIYWMYNTSLTPLGGLFEGQNLIPPVQNSLEIFNVFFTEVPIWRWLRNSAVVALGTTISSLAMAILAAYGLSRFRFFGKGILGFALFATQMLPEALLIVPMYALFMGLGLLDGYTGLVLANTAFVMPVAVWIIKSAMDGIPYEIEEAARVDGTRRLAMLTQIMIPLTAPSIAAASVIVFFDGWNDFLFASTFVTSSEKWLATVGLASFLGVFVTPLATVFSAAVVFTSTPLVFFLIMQRQIISGLTSGSVKG